MFGLEVRTQGQVTYVDLFAEQAVKEITEQKHVFCELCSLQGSLFLGLRLITEGEGNVFLLNTGFLSHEGVMFQNISVFMTTRLRA
jgi:hypothetical protein